MKKLLLITMLVVANQLLSAQYCGTTAQCSPSGTLTTGGFMPNEDIPCALRTQNTSVVIQFKNFDTMRYQGNLVTVQSLRIDSINNLPAGLCWVADQANRTYGNQQDGCIEISGFTSAAAGQYRLSVKLGVDIGLGVFIPVDAEAIGVRVYLRLITPLSICPPVDTSQTTSVVPYTNNFQNVALITGKLYFDSNQNQTFDVGEQPVPNQWITFSNGDVALTNSAGNYVAYPLPGTITIRPTLSGNIAGFAFNPDSITISADSGVIYNNNDFGIEVPANYCESVLSIVTFTPPPRPGFTNMLMVRFRNNISAVPVTQNIHFRYDALQSYVSATPAPNFVDTINRILIWNTTGINSGTTWSATVILHTPQTVAIGTVLTYSTWVSASTCAMNDVPQSDRETVVVGSYDPNDKAVSPVGEGVNGRVLPTSTFTYTIRFQNTGTYLAENVVVVDTMSPHLNLSTLKVLTASHNYEVVIRGREVSFRFNQINLPDSNANEPLSHGYIQYQIQPAASFVQNTLIENRADIYFDFNAPIRTNTTRSTADNFLSIPKMGADDFLLEVYPNPLSTGNWQVTVGSEAIGKQMEIYDMQGRKLYSVRMASEQAEINASHLPQGVYLLRIESKAARIVKL
jgi:uncharacterized repeat protein (TIGR01451 family)